MRLFHSCALYLTVALAAISIQLVQADDLQLPSKKFDDQLPTRSFVDPQSNSLSPDLAPLVDEIPNFKSVESRILRGGQPTEAGLAGLQKAGVKTIINLRSSPNEILLERRACNQLGLVFVNIPMDGLHPVSSDQRKQFLSILADKEQLPVFIHCQHGEDRTSCMVGIYRVETENWPAIQAYKEMLQNGFHPALVYLADSVFLCEQVKGKEPVKRPLGVTLYELMDQHFKLGEDGPLKLLQSPGGK
jgi:protein tyrosine phosphatase (PTP) superfamily phosphohydrolase (DUF442 family)